MRRRLTTDLVRGINPVDVALGLAMAVFAAIDVWGANEWNGPNSVNGPVVTGFSLALVLRRRYPTATLIAVLGSIAALGVVYDSSQAWAAVFPLVIATYSSAAHGPSPWLTIAVLAMLIPVRDLNDPYIATFGDALWTSSLSTLSLLAGLEGRMLARRSDRLDERAETLERDEELIAAAAADEERRRIARELHDIVAHGLGVMVLQAGAAEQVLDRDTAAARQALASVRSTGHDAISQMETLLGLVRSGAERSLEPQPTLAQLPELIDRMRDAGLQVSYDTEGDLATVAPALQLSAYRVAQEGMTNALKHAGDAAVRLAVRHRKGSLEVEVTDNGNGATRGRGSRRGLAGIAERVQVFGGTLSAGPGPADGWRLLATFPVAE